MNARESFANTINELDNGMPKTGNECFKFGITWGCKPDCPVFERGECEQQKDNEQYFKDNQIL